MSVINQYKAFVRNASPAQMDAMLEVIQRHLDFDEWKITLDEARKRLHIASVEGTLRVKAITDSL